MAKIFNASATDNAITMFQFNLLEQGSILHFPKELKDFAISAYQKADNEPKVVNGFAAILEANGKFTAIIIPLNSIFARSAEIYAETNEDGEITRKSFYPQLWHEGTSLIARGGMEVLKGLYSNKKMTVEASYSLDVKKRDGSLYQWDTLGLSKFEGDTAKFNKTQINEFKEQVTKVIEKQQARLESK